MSAILVKKVKKMDEYENAPDTQIYDPDPIEVLLREKRLKQMAIVRFQRRLAEIDRLLERLTDRMNTET